MRRALLPWLLAAALLLPGAALAQKSWSLQTWAVEITVTESGALQVHERLVYDFRGGDFTHAWREIPTTRLSSLTGLRVESTDVTIADQEVDEGRRRQRLRWTFPPRQGITSFDIHYLAEGAWLVDGEDNLLRWTAVGEEVGAPIERVAVRLYLPLSTGLRPEDLRPQPLSEAQVIDWEKGPAVTWVHRQLPADTPYTVVLRFPQRFEGAAPPPPAGPVWPLIVGAIGAGLLGLLPGLVLVRKWAGAHHEIPPGRAIAQPEQPPLEAAVLAASATRSAEKGFPATLFDLARRGHLRLERVKGKGLFAGKQVKVEILPSDDPLQPLERAFLEQLRGCKHLGEFGQKRWRWRRSVVRDLQRRHEARGLFEKHTTRSVLALLAGPLLMVAGFALGGLRGGQAWIAAAFLVGLGVGLAVTAIRVRVPTERGARLQAEIRAFVAARRERVEDLRRSDPVAAARLYVDELPWLSLDPKVDGGWVKKLQESLKGRAGDLQLPGWAVDRVDEQVLDHGAAYAAFVAYSHVSTAAAGGVAPSSGAAGATGAGAGAGGGAGGGGAGAG